jgi:esterase
MIELSVNKFGEGCPLIILHGLYGSGSNWLTIGKALSRHFTIYLVDQRNHGIAGHHPEFNYSVLTKDLELFLETQGLDSVCLLGHSMGGKVAMDFTLKHPVQVGKLAVIDIALRSYRKPENDKQSMQTIVHRHIINSLARLDIDFAESREEIDKQLAPYIPQRAIRQFLLKNLKRTREGEFYWSLNIPAIQQNLPEILGEIESRNKLFEGPVLIVSGKKSGYINENDKDEFRRVFPNSKIVELDTGHWVHSEEPSRLTDLLIDFFPKE